MLPCATHVVLPKAGVTDAGLRSPLLGAFAFSAPGWPWSSPFQRKFNESGERDFPRTRRRLVWIQAVGALHGKEQMRLRILNRGDLTFFPSFHVEEDPVTNRFPGLGLSVDGDEVLLFGKLTMPIWQVADNLWEASRQGIALIAKRPDFTVIPVFIAGIIIVPHSP